VGPKQETGRPGVMIYFDIRRQMERLSKEQRGDLLTAIMDFAELGTEPILDDMTGMCFDGIRPRIEKDKKRYEEKVLKSKYAVYVREAEKRGTIPSGFDEWVRDYESDSEAEYWI